MSYDSALDSESAERLITLLREFDTVMLITEATPQAVSARPMSVALVDSAGSAWFAASRDSFKVDDIRQSGRACITAQMANCYVVAWGEARIHDEREARHTLFREPMRVWFPGGPDDPALMFIELQLEGGRAWDLRGTKKIEYLFDALRAYFTGTVPDSMKRASQ